MSHKQSPRSNEQLTRTTIDNFNDAFNRHDADGLAALLTDDTVFENTSPAPDGRRIEGKAAVIEFWRAWFAHNAGARFEPEEVIVSGNRAILLWVYRKNARWPILPSARRRRLHVARRQSGRQTRLREGLIFIAPTSGWPEVFRLRPASLAELPQ